MDFIVTTVSSGLNFTNKLFFNPEDIKKFPNDKKYVYLSKQKQFFGYSSDARVPVGTVAIPSPQQVQLNLQPQVDKLKVDWYDFASQMFPNLSAALTLSLLSRPTSEKRLPVAELAGVVIDVTAKQSVTKLSVPELEDSVRSALGGHPFSAGQRLILQTKEAALRLFVDQIEPTHGFVGPNTLIRFDSSSGISLTGNPHSQQARLIPPGGFDFSKLGIGGLDKEFETVRLMQFRSRSTVSSDTRFFCADVHRCFRSSFIRPCESSRDGSQAC
jgi:hypothetical protein